MYPHVFSLRALRVCLLPSGDACPRRTRPRDRERGRRTSPAPRGYRISKAVVPGAARSAETWGARMSGWMPAAIRIPFPGALASGFTALAARERKRVGASHLSVCLSVSLNPFLLIVT